ncbi:MAG: Lrp/AsnC family transcriptional regulator [Candidatus Thermoplasmatota archaeon]|nr:Lrp/AsnC family transcriptional regulator [Candidatus Thermoplasmatota archaeon]
MDSIDVKDKKILFYLLQNSRQSLQSLGKNVGMSKELVSYRIRRLCEKHIITNFSIIINFLSLGYCVISSYYKYINIDPAMKEAICEFFLKSKHTFSVSLIDGRYDLQVDSFCGDLHEYQFYLDDIRLQYHPHLTLEHSMIPIKSELLHYAFLVNEHINNMKPLQWPMICQPVEIDTIDFHILATLSQDARTPTKTIADALHITPSTVRQRIRRLVQQKVILRYTINVDWLTLGYRWYHLLLHLNEYRKKHQIIRHMRTHPHLIRIYDLLIPDVDIHLALLLRDMRELRGIIEELTTQFPHVINDYRFYSTFQILKHNCMVPKILKMKTPLISSSEW